MGQVARLLLGSVMALWLGVAQAESTVPDTPPTLDVEALERALTASQGDTRLHLLAQLVEAYRNADPRKAVAYGDEALALPISRSLPAIRIQILNETSWALRVLGQYPRAQQLATQALALAEDHQDILGQARALNNLGIVYWYLGDNDIVLEHWLRALNLRRQAQDDKSIAGSLNNIGLVYLAQQQVDDAIEYFNQALVLSRENGNVEFEINHLQNLGEAYKERGEFGRAEDYYRQALALVSDRQQRGKIGVYVNLGGLYLAREDYPLARRWLTEARVMADALGAQPLILEIEHELATLAFALDDPEQAAGHLQTALGLAITLNNQNQLKELYHLQADVEVAREDYPAALAAMRKFLAYSEAVAEEKRQNRVMALQIRYEARQNARQIELLKKENAIHELELEQARTLSLTMQGGIAVLILFSLVIGYQYRAKARATRTIKRQYAELDATREELQRLAQTDPLTGLLNRRAMQQRLDVELARAGRENGCITVCLLDVDHFKEINDRHGHDMGDQVLVALSTLLKQQLRYHDILARWGGEEFVLLLINTDNEQAREVTERLRTQVAALVVDHESVSLGITATLGYSVYRPGQTTFDEVMKAADEALYEGKQGGRDRVVGKELQGSVINRELP